MRREKNLTRGQIGQKRVTVKFNRKKKVTHFSEEEREKVFRTNLGSR